MDKDAYQTLLSDIRPEIIRLLQDKQAYWEAKYSPFIGRIQDWMYDLYLALSSVAYRTGCMICI